MSRKRTPMTVADIDRLTEATADAYSFDRYRNWRACAALLSQRGYTYEEAECILRSKWTRWAADNSANPYGRVSSTDLAHFLDTSQSASPERLRSMMRN